MLQNRKFLLHWPINKIVFSSCSFSKNNFVGSSCSTVVEHTPYDREIVGSNPAMCWAFSLLYLISSALLIQVPHGGATLLIFLKICLAVQLEANQA